MSDVSGDITLTSRYTPWGDTLDTYGSGGFTFGYFGGVMDAATGLLYVGNGQYYDPQTGRFLTRNVNPNSTNPYTPWNPIGAIVGPLGLIALFSGRKKKGSKAGTFLVLLLVVGSVGMTLAACTPGSPAPTTPPPSNPNPNPTQTPGPDTIPSDTPTYTPSPVVIPTATPCATPTPTLKLEPWKTDRGYEIDTGSLGYDANSNSILRWGTDQSNFAREKKAERVYKWLCESGGYWGSGCPQEKTVVAWLAFEEVGTLYYPDQINVIRGIRYRFGRWGFNAKQLGAFTAFINPNRDDVFDDADWQALTAPNIDMSYYENMAESVYGVPISDNDGNFLYWFLKREMDAAEVTEANLNGSYSKTTDMLGFQVFFTGNSDVFSCAIEGKKSKKCK